MSRSTGQTGTFERVAECLYRYSTTGTYFALLKVRGKQPRVNLQTRDIATTKRKRDAEKNKLSKTDHDKRNCTLRECVETYLEGKSQLASKTRHRYRRVLRALTDHRLSGAVPLGDSRIAKVTLIDTVNILKARGIGFRVLTQQLDTTTPAGMLIFHVFGAIAEFERSLIQERTSAGLKAARARGRFGGRPKTLDQKKVAIAESLYRDGKTNVSEICKTLGMSRATFYRHIAARAA
jgi:DNA invertase Pin-like site-specific DNA recombinase